jgi:hypothetical protein
VLGDLKNNSLISTHDFNGIENIRKVSIRELNIDNSTDNLTNTASSDERLTIDISKRVLVKNDLLVGPTFRDREVLQIFREILWHRGDVLPLALEEVLEGLVVHLIVLGRESSNRVGCKSTNLCLDGRHHTGGSSK